MRIKLTRTHTSVFIYKSSSNAKKDKQFLRDGTLIGVHVQRIYT